MNEIKQLPSFNGWRAVAILLVLGSHAVFTAGFPAPLAVLVSRLFDGVLGVRVFFTISGFLITWLMVREENEFGFVSLKNFYLRRALRILPVYLACLLVLALLQMAGIASQSGSVWLQLLTFTRNFHQTGQVDYLVSAHCWSLAVEEQFYFTWPFVFLALQGSPGKRTAFLVFAILLSAGCKVIALLGCYNRHLYFLFQDGSTLLYLDCLAYGCLGAMLLEAKTEGLRQFFEKFALPLLLLAGLVILVPQFVGLGTGLQSLGFGCLLLQSVLAPAFGPFRVLNNRWVAKIGILSYSLYLWQQLVLLLWPAPRWWFLAVPMTFAAAWISYNFLEKPLLSFRSKFRQPAGAVAVCKNPKAS